MDCKKIGSLIYSLRKEKTLTQKQLADLVFVSDKAVSKWERGLGCPDVTLLPALSEVLGTAIKELLEGELMPNKKDTGDLRKVIFYVCPQCGNILTSTSEASISCCGRILPSLIAKLAEDDHALIDEVFDYYLNISANHPMTKEHHIAFMAIATTSTVWVHKLYPESEAAVDFPDVHSRATLYAYCTVHGLWSKPLRR